MRATEAVADASQLADQRRTQIIDEARRLFGERGTTEVSMDEIATHAGVARSTVYVYFANRAELLVACVDTLYHQLTASLEVGLDQDPPARLTSLFAALFRTIDDHPAFFRLAIATQGTQGQLGQAMAANLAVIGTEMEAALVDLLTAGAADGSWRAPDPAELSILVGQQIFGALLVRAADPHPPPADRAADILATYVTFGLNPPPQQGERH